MTGVKSKNQLKYTNNIKKTRNQILFKMKL